LSLDGTICAVPGALPAAVMASSHDLGLICPEPNGAEAAWAGDLPLLAPQTLVQLINHFKGTQILDRPVAGEMVDVETMLNMRDVRGQETAKRALEGKIYVGGPYAGAVTALGRQ